MNDAEKDEIKQLIKEFVVDKPSGGASKSPGKTKKTAAVKQSVLGGASPSKKTPGSCPQALCSQACHTQAPDLCCSHGDRFPNTCISNMRER